MIQSIDYYAIAAPLILAVTAGIVLLLGAFLPFDRPRRRADLPAATVSDAGSRVRAGDSADAIAETPGSTGPAGASGRAPSRATILGGVTLVGVLAALGVIAAQGAQGAVRRTFCVPAGLNGGGPSACSFVIDGVTLVFAGVMLASGVVIVLLSMGEIAKGTVPAGEWYFLLLCTLTGAVLLPASRDLIMLVVALELVSLPVFALAALRRHDPRGSEAALKLFLVSVVSTAVTLFGISLLYGMSGTVFLDRLGVATERAEFGPNLGLIVTVLVVAGFAFKVAAVPFHFWAADVYRGAAIPVAALLSVISKAAGFAGLILLLTTALGARAALWTPVVAVLSALTMTAGNLLALRQRQAVRLLAWSSVAQSGYILAPLAVWGTGRGAPAAASMAYLVFYAAMNIGAFAVVMLVARGSADEGGDAIDDYRGLLFRRPAAALSLAFFLICLAGLPPGMAGLFAKIVVFREIVDGGAGWLAVVMAVNTVVGLYYYVGWAARLFTAEAPGAGREPYGGRGRRAGPVGVAIAATLAAAVLFSVAPQVVFGILPSAVG
ncbi:NADH-quinone oxidoreductase subunit N [Thermopolyspora sp. NPDC052614]|uniref:NADH-quinone oxidoreductase subunit N n=1 Tax=Thermopolyspora sp. NPDC052614 TaxID=3155682 RepID=UPI00344A5CE8